MVAGSDVWRWVGYCFVDTYFDAAEDARETVQQYHDDSQVDEGSYMDPFTFGIKDAEAKIHDPREYFLVVFQIRIDQVRREWEQVVGKVGESIREYEMVRYIVLIDFYRGSSSVIRFSKKSRLRGGGHRELHWVHFLTRHMQCLM
jgi:hypothetical protein